MEIEEKTTNGVSWTWADQISSYRFWGISLFFFFLMIPNLIMNYLFPMFTDNYGISTSEIGTIMTLKSAAGFGGLWLAWFMARMKNHYLLFLYAGLAIIGFFLILLMQSIVSLLICAVLTGLCFGAISLAIPTIISGGKGGSEMFVVSFGLIIFFELVAWSSFNGLFGILVEFMNNPNNLIAIGLVSSLIGIILLLPVKSELFNVTPPERKKYFTPVQREPIIVALLCLIPLYNIYYILVAV